MKILKAFFSIKISLILLLLFAFFAGAATFIEAKFGTASAFADVYAAKYFEIIQILLALNLLGAIFVYKIYEKTALFVFHLSFLFILLGSALTRYYGFEGSLHIREGEGSDKITSMQNYFSLSDGEKNTSKAVYLSRFSRNHFSMDLDGAKLTLIKSIPHAKSSWEEGKNGEKMTLLHISSPMSSRALPLFYQNYTILDDLVLSNSLDIKVNARVLDFSDSFATPNFDIDYIVKGEKKHASKGEKIRLESALVFLYGDYKIGYDKSFARANEVFLASDNQNAQDAYKMQLCKENECKEFYLQDGKSATISINGKNYYAGFGAKQFRLPFELKLEKFTLERYAFSNSPKSYSSKIVLPDGEKVDIFMNNVLDFKGYRFFQSSYDKDLKGTILSVNKDPGKIPTYIGYFLLALGLLANLFSKNSRFNALRRRLIALLFALILLPNINLKADEIDLAIENASKNLELVSLHTHAASLATLAVQKDNGKIAPFGIVAIDLMNKIHKSKSFDGLNANEVMIKIFSDFPEFAKREFVYCTEPKIREILQKTSGKFISFNDAFKDGKYLLEKEVAKALRTKPANRTTFEKELLKVDERINLLYFTAMGGYLRAFFEGEKALDLISSKDVRAKAYIFALASAHKNGNFALAQKILREIKAGQKEHLDKTRFSLWVAFDNISPFTKIAAFSFILGFLMLLIIFARLIKAEKKFEKSIKFLMILSFLLFITQTICLAIRGYLAGHAPWSNSYESLLYIAWALLLSGVVFGKKSPISMALSMILASCVLLVAHLGSIDPAIGNLAPVLQSYWLSIHVSVITASYGFLGLCALLGLFALILFALLGKNEERNQRFLTSIKEACTINEMAMILGLSLLTVGNFLGGVWANESWGRYWGWDSKETWALVSILVYAFVLHARLVRIFNNQFAFSVLSLFAYWSVIMTYFGVNYFLSGMHSYAAASAAAVPNYVYFILLAMVILTLFAARNYKKAKKL